MNQYKYVSITHQTDQESNYGHDEVWLSTLTLFLCRIKYKLQFIYVLATSRSDHCLSSSMSVIYLTFRSLIVVGHDIHPRCKPTAHLLIKSHKRRTLNSVSSQLNTAKRSIDWSPYYDKSERSVNLIQCSASLVDGDRGAAGLADDEVNYHEGS